MNSVKVTWVNSSGIYVLKCFPWNRRKMKYQLKYDMFMSLESDKGKGYISAIFL